MQREVTLRRENRKRLAIWIIWGVACLIVLLAILFPGAVDHLDVRPVILFALAYVGVVFAFCSGLMDFCKVK